MGGWWDVACLGIWVGATKYDCASELFDYSELRGSELWQFWRGTNVMIDTLDGSILQQFLSSCNSIKGGRQNESFIFHIRKLYLQMLIQSIFGWCYWWNINWNWTCIDFRQNSQRTYRIHYRILLWTWVALTRPSKFSARQSQLCSGFKDTSVIWALHYTTPSSAPACCQHLMIVEMIRQ